MKVSSLPIASKICFLQLDDQKEVSSTRLREQMPRKGNDDVIYSAKDNGFSL